jgi:amino acid transporter
MHAQASDPLLSDPRSARNAAASWDLFRVVGGGALIAASVAIALWTPGGFQGLEASLVRCAGVVLLFVGVKNWASRRSAKHEAVPRDPDRVSRAGMIAIVAVIALSIALFAEPQRIFAWLSGGGRLASLFDYDPGFRSQRLPWLFAAWTVQAVMLGVLAARGRWNPQLRWASLILAATIALLCIWYRASGPVMAAPGADQTVKVYMELIAALLLIDVAVRLHARALTSSH